MKKSQAEIEALIWKWNGVSGGCGASNEQKDIEKKQSGLMDQMTQQAQQIFGSSSTVFKDLINTFAPTVAAGPNQRGFSLPEKAAMDSAAITNTGRAYKNASQAVRQGNAAYGGGNESLPGGADIGRNLSIANEGAARTADSLNQIEQADWATGRQNYDFATQGLAGAPNVFGAATSAGDAAVGAGNAAANTANQISQQNNSWVSAVTGALGGVAGDVATGGMKNLGEGKGFFGG